MPIRHFKLLSTVLLITTLSSCSNILMYKSKPFFSEKSMIMEDSIFRLYQFALYDKPGTKDEERNFYLTLNIYDTAAVRKKTILNFPSDTLIAKPQYGVVSIWNWTPEINKISGWVKILKWDKDHVVLQEHVDVYDIRRGEKKQFYGTRTYVK